MQVSSLKFVLKRRDEEPRELIVDSDVALVGSGAHCEIRLPTEQAATEQLRVEARAGAIFAEARSLDPVTLLHGTPFTRGRLLPDSSLFIGETELRVDVAQSELTHRKKSTNEAGANKLVLALGAIGFPLGFWLLFTTAPAPAGDAPAVRPPALFTGKAVSCPETNATAALAAAETELQRADNSRERAPFEAAEGVSAVAQFRRASACFQVAARGSDASEATRAADALERKMNQEFRLHQVRLERAQATSHYPEARREVRLLLSFIGRRGGEYGNWLAALDRRIELLHSGKKD